MILVVDKAHVDGHLELHLTAVSATAYTLVELVESCNLSRELQVAVLLHLPQLGLRCEDVSELVLEDRLHGCPHIGTPYGEVVYLYGLGLGVVYACSVELIGDLACA